MRALLIITLTSILFASCQNTQENETGSGKQLNAIDTQTTEADDNWVEMARARGVSKFENMDHMRAIADYTKAIELDPNDARVYVHRGNSKYFLQDYRGAIADYTKAIELDPNDAEVYYFRGSSKLFIGQKDSGCYDLSKAAELGVGQAYDLIQEYCN